MMGQEQAKYGEHLEQLVSRNPGKPQDNSSKVVGICQDSNKVVGTLVEMTVSKGLMEGKSKGYGGIVDLQELRALGNRMDSKNIITIMSIISIMAIKGGGSSNNSNSHNNNSNKTHGEEMEILDNKEHGKILDNSKAMTSKVHGNIQDNNKIVVMDSKVHGEYSSKVSKTRGEHQDNNNRIHGEEMGILVSREHGNHLVNSKKAVCKAIKVLGEHQGNNKVIGEIAEIINNKTHGVQVSRVSRVSKVNKANRVNKVNKISKVNKVNSNGHGKIMEIQGMVELVLF
jgi:hypothetical protein